MKDVANHIGRTLQRTRESRGFLIAIILAGVLFSLFPLPARACPVCIVLPERTVSDRLVGDPLVVLARPSAENPFQYAVVETLRGDPAASAPPPFLVSSVLRRRFAEDPDLTVLLTFGPREPTAPIPSRFQSSVSNTPSVWNQLMVLDARRQALVREVVLLAPDWGFPRDTPGSAPRFDYFAALLGSDDPALHRLALRELPRWPYARLRTMTVAVPASEIQAALNDINRLPEGPILILLLGLSTDPGAADAVRRGARAGFEGGLVDRLGAWAVALAERDGAAAIDALMTSVLDRADRGTDVQQAALTALDTIGRAMPDLRPRAADAVTDLALSDASLMPQVARSLLRWQDWRLLGLAEARLTSSVLPPAEAFALRHYVMSARTASR